MVEVDEGFIEKLDFSYVKKCSDEQELRQMLIFLKTGKEGYYPDLEKAIEDRMIYLWPKLEDELRPEIRRRISTHDKQAVEQDLANWCLEMKESESAASEAYYEAERLKVNGNESLKSGDISEAIDYYSKSLKTLEQPHVLNNRSLAYYKNKRYDLAIADASRSIELDASSNNAKAYARKGMALKATGNYYDAIVYFLEAEKRDQENMSYYVQIRLECETKYLDVEGKQRSWNTFDEKGVRSKLLPEACSKESITKQTELKLSRSSFKKINIIEVDDDDE